jgi:hypothetical protein
MTAPHPALAMIEHGDSRLDTARTDGITKAYDGLAVLMSLVNAGKIPGRFLVGLGEWSEQVAMAVDNGEPIPSLGSSATSGSDIKPEHRALIRAVENGTVQLDDRTGLPKAADSDDSKLDDALKRIEKAQGRSVATSDLKMRLDGIVEGINEAKSGGTGDDVTKLLDELGKAAKVKRNSGESDEDYQARIIEAVKSNLGWETSARKVESLLKDKTGLDPNGNENYDSYTARMVGELEGSGVGGFRFGRGSRS